MATKRKAKVGDTIRHNGKNPAYRAGEEFVVDRIIDQPGDSNGEYYVCYNRGGYTGSAWDTQFDIVEPEPEFQRGDKVRLTPKAGGETVIVGEVTWVYEKPEITEVRIDSGYSHSFDRSGWNIEKITPSTVDILNGLGENAFVAHRTDPRYYGYYKRVGKWYSADAHRDPVEPEDVAYWVDGGGEEDSSFEIIFEGVKS